MENLAVYISSDSEEESGKDDHLIDRKRKDSSSSSEEKINSRKKTCHDQEIAESKSIKLPMPDGIKKMFADEEDTPKDDPSKHGGRVRTFAHERGNWASYVYIPFDDDSWCKELSGSVLKCLRVVGDFQAVDHFHISLSRTFILRHHWIDPMVESLRSHLSTFPGALIDFSTVETYTNDEQTRTFVGIKVGSGADMMRRYMRAVDSSLQEFKLPKYYEDPSFHMSVGWCVGDKKSAITKEVKEKVQREVDEYFCCHPRSSVIGVKNLMLKTGNKEFLLRCTC